MVSMGFTLVPHDDRRASATEESTTPTANDDRVAAVPVPANDDCAPAAEESLPASNDNLLSAAVAAVESKELLAVAAAYDHLLRAVPADERLRTAAVAAVQGDELLAAIEAAAEAKTKRRPAVASLRSRAESQHHGRRENESLHGPPAFLG